MRSVFASVLASGLLIALCASAQAAAAPHAKPRHAMVHRSRDAVRGFAAPAGADPRSPPVLEDQTPRYDDPSKFGGG
jgi:hypothetical protein